MAKPIDIQVRIDAALNADATIKNLRELKQIQKELVAGSDDYKKVQQKINDIGDATKTAKTQSQDLVDSLAAAPGPVGALGRVIDTVSSSTNKFGLALKATGIGLVVGLVGLLVKAFSENEKAMKKLEPIMNAFQQILGGIFTALEPVFNVITDLALKAMPILTNAIGGVITAFTALGSFLKNFFQTQFKLFGAFGKVLKGVFTLDWDTIKEGISDGVDAVKTGVENVVNTTKDTWNNYKKGTKDLTKTEKEELEKRKEANAKAAEDKKKKQKEAQDAAKKAAEEALQQRKADLDAQIKLETDKENTSRETLTALYQKRYEAEIKGQKLSDAQKQVLRDENAKKVEEALKQDTDAQQKAFDDQLKKLQETNKLKVDELTANLGQIKNLYGEDSKEARKAQDDIYQAQYDALEAEKQLLLEKKDLTEQEKSRLKSIAIEEQNLTNTKDAENKKRIENDVNTFLRTNEAAKKASDDKFRQAMADAEFDLQQQQTLLDEKTAKDKLYYETLLANANLTKDQRAAIEAEQTATVKANAETQLDIQKKKQAAEFALLDATANAISAVADIAGKNTVAGKALAVAASLISTYTAIAKQLAAFAGVPVPGYAVVQAIATGLVGFKAVRDIIATPIPTSGGGGTSTQGTGTANNGPSVAKPRGLAKGGLVQGPGTGTSDSIPALLSHGESVINAASTAMFAPLLSTINQIGGGRKFASGGMALDGFNQSQAMTNLTNAFDGNDKPVKTYVVARDMSNQQMLDRAIKSRSTI